MKLKSNNKYHIIFFSFIMVLFLSLSGCITVEVINEEENINTYSREHTEIMAASYNFGYGRSDDVYVALKYLYENEDISTAYGNEFEISAEDIICYKSEGETKWIKSNFKGEADYSFKVSDVRYRIKLSKDYKEKWKVDSCELEMDE